MDPVPEAVLQSGQRMLREPGAVIVVAVGPPGVALFEREDFQLAGEARGRVGDATGDECGGHGGREANVFEGVALLEFGVGRYGFVDAYDVERKFHESRMYKAAPVNNNLVTSFVTVKMLGIPRSY